MLDSIKPRTRARQSWVVSLIAVAMCLGVIQACHHHAQVVNIPPPCQHQHRVQGLLIELARRSMLTFGRIDPLIYEVREDGLHLSESAKALRSDELDGFRDALDRVIADSTARATLLSNISAALGVCGEGGCPGRPYQIAIGEDVSEPHVKLYRWQIQDSEPPTELQWRGFATLYTAEVPEARCCKAANAVNVESRTMGFLMAMDGPCADPDGETPPKEGHECTPPEGGKWHWERYQRRPPRYCWMCY